MPTPTPADPQDRNVPGQDRPWPNESYLNEIYGKDKDKNGNGKGKK